jgi:hypothetical protein
MDTLWLIDGGATGRTDRSLLRSSLKGLRARKGWAYRMARDAIGPRFDPESFDKGETTSSPLPPRIGRRKRRGKRGA